MKLLFLLLLAPAALLAQGNLIPPGPPAATMKSLNQIHAGTPIASLPVTISAPGHYYLTGNLSASQGITITSSNVSLDLRGFSLTVADTAVKVTGAAGAELSNVAIFNGSVGASFYGVRFIHVCNSSLRDLSFTSSFTPISLEAPGGQSSGNRIERCVVFDHSAGIQIRATEGGVCQGNVLQSCIVNGSTSSGGGIAIRASGGNCDGNIIRDCIVGSSGASSNGIALLADAGGRCSGNTISRCTISQVGRGIFLNGNPSGIVEGNLIEECTIHDATSTQGIQMSGTGDGVCRGNRVVECSISKAASFGIYIAGDSDGGTEGNAIERCVVSGTTVHGIVAFNRTDRGRVAGNHVTSVSVASGGSTAEGISTTDNAARNLVIHNSVANALTSFNLVFGPGTNGPVVTSAGTLPDSGSPNHPWANFAR